MSKSNTFFLASIGVAATAALSLSARDVSAAQDTPKTNDQGSAVTAAIPLDPATYIDVKHPAKGLKAGAAGGCMFTGLPGADQLKKDLFWSDTELTFAVPGWDSGVTITRGRKSMALGIPHAISAYPRKEPYNSSVYAINSAKIASVADAHSALLDGKSIVYGKTNPIAGKKQFTAFDWNSVAAWQVPKQASNSAWISRIYKERIADWFFRVYEPKGVPAPFPGHPTRTSFRNNVDNSLLTSRADCMQQIDDIAQNVMNQYLGLRRAVLTNYLDKTGNTCTAKEYNAFRAMWAVDMNAYRHWYKINNRIAVFRGFASQVICSNAADLPKSDSGAALTAANRTVLVNRLTAARNSPFNPLLWGIVDVFSSTANSKAQLEDYPLVPSAYYNLADKKKTSEPDMLNSYFVNLVDQ